MLTDIELIKEMVCIYIICRDNKDFGNVMYTLSRILVEKMNIPLNVRLNDVDFEVKKSIHGIHIL